MLMVTPNFHFNGQCGEAIELYQKVFGAQVTERLCYAEADPRDVAAADEEKDLVYHAEMFIGNQRVFLSDIIDATFPRGNSLSLVVTFETADDVKAAFAAMADGAVVICPMKRSTYSACFVSFIDKYGMRWELMTEGTEGTEGT